MTEPAETGSRSAITSKVGLGDHRTRLQPILIREQRQSQCLPSSSDRPTSAASLPRQDAQGRQRGGQVTAQCGAALAVALRRGVRIQRACIPLSARKRS